MIEKINIELYGKMIYSKLLKLNETIEKNENIIDRENEKEFNLQDILLESNLIKLKSSDIKVQFDLSKYEEKEKKDDLVIYRYSKLERQSDHKLVYQYFYDKFDINDYKVAYIILFVGKTGEGKSTVINAFFNIIKGIQLEDKYRFILI